MPYKDREDERARQRRRYAAGHGRQYLESATWADGQIALLRSMGIRHTVIEWSEIRTDLIKSKITRATADGLKLPPATTDF